MSDATLQTVSTLLWNEHMRIVEVPGRAAYSDLLVGIIEAIQDFVMKKKVPSVINYLKYEPTKVQALQNIAMSTLYFVLLCLY